MIPEQSSRPGGLTQAIAAYSLWGLMPLYIGLLNHFPAFELVGWRIIFTLPVCLIIVAARSQGRELLAAIRNPRVIGLLAGSALVIGANWLIFTFAVYSGHVFATSLGYYINPLINVLAGTVFLRERLSPRQWLAVAITAAGVTLLAWDALEMLGISLALALTFACYGLIRKFAPVGSLPGLTIESSLLLLPAAGIVLWSANSPSGSSFGYDTTIDLLVVASGVVTATPLLLFAIAARRMELSALGFVQFIAPTMQFLTGLLIFHEPLMPVQFVCFVIIWGAIAIFCWDLWAKRERRRTAET